MQKFLFWIVLGILVAGCSVPDNNSPAATSTPTTIPVITASPEETPPPVPPETENSSAQQSRIDANWREIQLQWDTFLEKEVRLFGAEATGNEINNYRKTIIPDALADFSEIKSELEKIQSSDAGIMEDRENLIKICEYKIYQLEASSAYYHGLQMAESDRQKAINEYRNAKYAYQNALGIINSFDEDSPYYPYISNDESDLISSIAAIDTTLETLSS
jgi:hypothetical protein